MRLTTFSPEELHDHVPTFNRWHEGWTVRVEERSPDVANGRIAVGAPVDAALFVALDEEDGHLFLRYRGARGVESRYDVGHPLGIRRVHDGDRTDELRVEDERGRTTRLRFVRPVPLGS